MKQLLFCLLLPFLFLLSSPASAMKIYNGDLTIDSQAGIDTFSYNYLTGTLWIESPYITNLNGLASLQRANNLYIVRDTALTTLSGLENLQVVEGSFDLSYNEKLMNLDALLQLDSVKGSFDIRYNFDLTSISGLNSLQAVGNLHFYYNVDMTSLNGFYQLNSADQISIWECHQLSDLHGLSALSVANQIYVVNNPVLQDICSIAHFAGTETSITLDGNATNDFSGCITSTKAGPNRVCSIYPNPFSSELRLGNVSAGTEVVFYSMTGEVVFREKVWNSGETLAVSNLQAGIYWVELITSNGILRERLVKR